MYPPFEYALIFNPFQFRKRNYILDQTNVYPTARVRKIKDFKGFKITTMCVVPNDAEFKRRCQQRFIQDGIGK